MVWREIIHKYISLLWEHKAKRGATKYSFYDVGVQVCRCVFIGMHLKYKKNKKCCCVFMWNVLKVCCYVFIGMYLKYFVVFSLKCI